MKKIIILSISAVLAFNASLFAEPVDVSLDFSGKREVNAALRSTLMPGWGQHYNEQPTKGWIVLGLFGVCAVGAFYYNNQAFSTYDKYKNYGMIESKYYDDYESQYLTSQIFTFAAIGVWLYGIIDAYVVSKSGVISASAVNFYYSKSSDAYYLSYSKKI
jgi:TM2 domain-containing membrane protein YozV